MRLLRQFMMRETGAPARSSVHRGFLQPVIGFFVGLFALVASFLGVSPAHTVQNAPVDQVASAAIGTDRPLFPVEGQPVYATSSPNSAPALPPSPPSSSPAIVVYEYVTQPSSTTQTPLAVSEIAESTFTTRLQELDYKLSSRIAFLSTVGASNANNIVQNYNVAALASRIDLLASAQIQNSTFTGGTISNADISGGSISDVSFSPSALTVSGDATFTNATSTNFFATTASTTNLFAATATLGTLDLGTLVVNSTLFAGTTTLAALSVTNTSTSTFVGGVSVANLNVVGAATSTYGNGINVATGCFAIANNCLASGASLSGANTWTALQTFQTGLISQASSTFVAPVNMTNASTSQFTTTGSTWFSSLASTLLGTDQNGKLVATSSVGTSLLTGTLGTINSTVLTAGSAITITAASSTLLSNSNNWTGLNLFSNASSTNHSVFGTLWVGGSATTSIQGSITGTSTIQGFLNVAGTNSTSTFSGNLSVSNLNVGGSATSTYANGISLATGCFSIGGTCLMSGASLSGANSWTALQTFQSGLISQASSTIGNGTPSGGLTIFGDATTTGNAFFTGNVGVGTTTPTSKFSIQGAAGLSAFAVASSTGASMLTVNADGSLDAKLKQLTADYLVDAGSQTIAVGDIVSHINGKAMKASGPAVGGSITAGTPVTVSSSGAASYTTAAILDSTHFVLANLDAGGVVYTVIGTVSGTTVTYGTQVYVWPSANASHVSVAVLDSTHFVVALIDIGTGYANAVVSTVSGTTITAGTPVVLHAVASTYTSVSALDSTKFVVAYARTGVALYAVVSTVSGTTITAGNPVDLNAVASTYTSVAALDSAKFVVSYTGASLYVNAVVSTVSGTTITAGTPVALNAIASSDTSVAALDSTKFVVAYKGGSNFANAVVSTVSGTTITAGTPVALNAASANYESVAALDSAHFVVTYQNNVTTFANAVVSTVSGTTITAGTPVALNAVASTYTSVAALDSAKFVTVYRGASSRATAVVGQTLGFNILGIATNATTTNSNMVAVASNGIVGGYSGLTAGSTYYWSPTTGATTTSQSYKLGLAISSTQILLNSGNGGASASTDQFFGDMIFANNFRFTEGWEYPQSLIFKNQLGREILEIDENGNMSIVGAFTASNLDANVFRLLGTATIDEFVTATTTESAWLGSFADAGDALKSALQSFTSEVIQVLGKVVYATTGIFENVFAKELTFDRATGQELCLNKSNGTQVCVTGDQLAAIGASVGTSTPDTVSPVITLNGENPAHINIGDAYSDLGAVVTDNVDQNLGYRVSLDGATSTDSSALVLDTSTSTTHIITYSATDQAGNIGIATRTVIVGE